jgi:hypothetical protein
MRGIESAHVNFPRGGRCLKTGSLHVSHEVQLPPRFALSGRPSRFRGFTRPSRSPPGWGQSHAPCGRSGGERRWGGGGELAVGPAGLYWPIFPCPAPLRHSDFEGTFRPCLAVGMQASPYRKRMNVSSLRRLLDYMWAMMLSPNSEHLIWVAPSIWRAKS